jgi:hypothetical protein
VKHGNPERLGGNVFEPAVRSLTRVMPAKADTQTCFYVLVTHLGGNDEEFPAGRWKPTRRESGKLFPTRSLSEEWDSVSVIGATRYDRPVGRGWHRQEV